MLRNENILFHALKHHVGAIRRYLEQSRHLPAEQLVTKFAELKTIGSSTLDLYTGQLSQDIIQSEILQQLAHQDIRTVDHYLKMLGEPPNDYHMLTLSDCSVWVLREGKESQRFVHLHPGRYSPFSMRTSANALKSSLAVVMFSILHNESDLLALDVINSARSLIRLSPVGDMKQVLKIRKLLEIFRPPLKNY